MTGHTTNYYTGEEGGKKMFSLKVDFEQSHRRQSVVRSSAIWRERFLVDSTSLEVWQGCPVVLNRLGRVASGSQDVLPH